MINDFLITTILKMNLPEIKRYQQLHAMKRCKERYGFDFTEEDNRAIVHIINKKHYIKKHLSCRKPVYYVFYAGEYLRVVMDRKTQQIVTFLPLEEP